MYDECERWESGEANSSLLIGVLKKSTSIKTTKNSVAAYC